MVKYWVKGRVRAAMLFEGRYGRSERFPELERRIVRRTVDTIIEAEDEDGALDALLESIRQNTRGAFSVADSGSSFEGSVNVLTADLEARRAGYPTLFDMSEV